MTIAGLDLIESDLDDGVGHDRAHAPVVLDGVLQKIARHLCDLLVREPGIRLSDVEKTLSVADRERVVGQHPASFRGPTRRRSRPHRAFAAGVSPSATPCPDGPGGMASAGP